jgi:hypothetical protein
LRVPQSEKLRDAAAEIALEIAKTR